MYDAFAAEFEAHACDGAWNAHYDRPAVFKALGEVDGLRVLDAGCGPGLYAEELVRRGADVVGVDQSAEMVRLARRRLSRGADLRVHDLRDPLDWLPPASVDRVVMALVLHHLQDPVPALREFHRVLRPDGVLVISTVHPVMDWRARGGSYFTDEMVDDIWRETWAVRYRRAPLQQWCAEFAEAGFVIEQLIEPRPGDQLRDRDPAVHARLQREPGFILFRLAKA